MASTTTYCINHPKTETLLRCIKCGNPVCIKCVVRTPVGYRCKHCTNVQLAGYYNATSLDHIIVAIVGTIASMIGGGIAMVISGFWWFAVIFYAPAAGGIVAEIIRWCIRKRRGKYIWLIACGALVIGGLMAAGALPLLFFVLLLLGEPGMIQEFASSGILGAFFNLGVWIYIVMGVGTVYVRLKS